MATDPEINFISVALTELTFKLNEAFVRPKDGMPIEISVKSKNSLSPDKTILKVILSVSLFGKTENQPFEMKVSIAGTFTGKDTKELEKFSKIHAPAHLFPFVREIIGTTTMKAGIPPLLLPPFNLASLLSTKKHPA